MSKNIVHSVRVDWEDLEDLIAEEDKRAKFQAVAVKETKKAARNDSTAKKEAREQWAFDNAVDDAAIVSIFGEDSVLLSLPYEARLRELVKAAREHGKTVRV